MELTDKKHIASVLGREFPTLVVGVWYSPMEDKFFVRFAKADEPGIADEFPFDMTPEGVQLVVAKLALIA